MGIVGAKKLLQEMVAGRFDYEKNDRTRLDISVLI